MTGSEPYFAGGDWGTTRLRVWIMDDQGNVIAERRSDLGMTSVPTNEFATVLENELTEAGAGRVLPVVICGMAGSRQGWVEVPYLETPVALDALAHGAVRIEDANRPVFILPGLSQIAPGADVMRGEETQIAGASTKLAEGDQLICLPGTHSKWAKIGNGAITSFSTFMTGEMFALISAHSILRHSVGADAKVDASNPVFLQRLHESLAEPETLLTRLFSIRAAGLLSNLSPDDASAALSGHLIGTEIAAVRNTLNDEISCPVALVASGSLGSLYQAALNEAGLAPQLIDADEAVRAGLLRAAKNGLNNQA